jgi:hypothetical protein
MHPIEMSDSPLTIGIDFGGTTVKIAVVFQSQIIDHAPPIATQDFDSCDALICGGVFIVAVHNERSWSAKLMKNRSPIIDVEHTHLYTPKTGKMIFEKAGFVDVTTGTYSNHYSLAYLLHLLPISRRLRRIILKSYIGLILSKIKVVVPLGNMWIVGTKP